MIKSPYTLKDYKTLVKQIWKEEPVMSLTALRRFYPSINEHKMVERIADQILGGDSIALISDAGTPSISDPGFLPAISPQY